MGCLNADIDFKKWFANIHLSGPCNRSCYFCIGQHMMSVDSLNTLDEWPLPGIDDFIERCLEKGINEVNMTGTNTDPMLYKHLGELKDYLKLSIPDLTFGVRTNGATIGTQPSDIDLFDKGSISMPTIDDDIYKTIMGNGTPPNLIIANLFHEKFPNDFKITVVLCPENTGENIDVLMELLELVDLLGYSRVVLREPYGQPHIGDPLDGVLTACDTTTIENTTHYHYERLNVVYWDVHFVGVNSINLYANGHVSDEYAVTKGVDFDKGEVKDQSHFKQGRQVEQWIK